MWDQERRDRSEQLLLGGPDLRSKLRSAVQRWNEASERSADDGAWGTFHVAGPRTLGRMDFARLAARAFTLDEGLLAGRSSAAIGYRAARPLACGLDDAKLRAALGHGLTEPDEGLAAMRTTEPG